MNRLEQIEARMRAINLEELEIGLRQDVTMLKALTKIAALREQAVDPAVLNNLEALATSIETRTASLVVLDRKTPPPVPPV